MTGCDIDGREFMGGILKELSLCDIEGSELVGVTIKDASLLV